MRILFQIFLLLLALGNALGAERIPARSDQYVDDQANMLSAGTKAALTLSLQDLEKTNSTQIKVALFPKRESESSLEDYTVRVAEAWGVGQKETDNGAILFVFRDNREVRIEVGYGLEGALPDARCKEIIETRITPYFREGNFDQGIREGVTAMIQAARGEYQGTGVTQFQRNQRSQGGKINGLIFIFIIAFFIISALSRKKRGTVYRRSGRSNWGGGPFFGSGGGSFGGGGGGWGGGGGGFSGGGGSFGGGGASGRW